MKKSTILLLAGYVLFLIAFFFLGMPKPQFPATLIAFAVVTGIYGIIVLFVKKFIAK